MKQIIADILAIKDKSFDDLKREGSMKIKNKGYMDLDVDYLGNECGFDKYAISHHYQQNGDSMDDPDMMFYDAGEQFYATSFEQSNPQVSQFSVECKGKELWKNPKLQKQHQSFSNQWSRNLKEQGFTEVKPENIIFGDKED